METLAVIRAKKLYDVIRFPVGTHDFPDLESKGREASLTYHSDCGFSFFSFFNFMNIPGGYTYEGDHFTCPRCGKELDYYVRGPKDLFWTASKEHYIPVNARLTLKEGKDFLDLALSFDSISGEKHYGIEKHRASTAHIRFDFRNRKTFYWFLPEKGIANWQDIFINRAQKMELAVFRYPKDDSESEAGSNLRGDGKEERPVISIYGTPFHFLGRGSYFWKDHKKEIYNFAKVLTQAFRRHLEKAEGRKLPSPYIPISGGEYGFTGVFNNLLRNLAWRMLYPEAPNLSKEDLRATIERRFKFHGSGDTYANISSPDMIYYDLLSMAGKRSYRSAIEFSVKSPVAKPVLAVLAKAPIRSYFILKQLMQIFKAPERQAAAFERIALSGNRNHNMDFIRSGLRLVKLLSLIKGEDKALHLVLCQPWGATLDCSDTYFNLKRERRRLFWRTRLKPKEIHDWLVKEFNKQVTENVLFYGDAKGGTDRSLAEDTPEGVFSLATDSHTLKRWGSGFHNCVATYQGKVEKHNTAIVGFFVKGKPLVCIEVSVPEGAVMQAKLPCNKQVKENPALLQAVKAWAVRKRLKVVTDDMEVRTVGI